MCLLRSSPTFIVCLQTAVNCVHTTSTRVRVLEVRTLQHTSTYTRTYTRTDRQTDGQTQASIATSLKVAVSHNLGIMLCHQFFSLSTLRSRLKFIMLREKNCWQWQSIIPRLWLTATYKLCTSTPHPQIHTHEKLLTQRIVKNADKVHTTTNTLQPLENECHVILTPFEVEDTVEKT